MDIMLKIGIPAILIVIGIVCLLIGKRNDSKAPTFIGMGSALIGVLWIIVGTF